MDVDKDAFPELGSVYRKAGPGVNSLSRGIENIILGSAEDGKSAAKPRSPLNSAYSPWGCLDVIKKLGMQSTDRVLKVDNNNSRSRDSDGGLSDSKQEKNGEDRWDVLSARLAGATHVNGWTVNQKKEVYVLNSDDKHDAETVSACNDDYDKNDYETVSYSSDDDDYDYDSDDSEKSHDSCKKM